MVLQWPSDRGPAEFIEFQDEKQWRTFVAGLGISEYVPDIVRIKFLRAQKLFLLGWVDTDLMAAGELVALTALELALRDRYGSHFRGGRKPTLSPLLIHIVSADGLTDQKIPVIARCGGTAIAFLTGDARPSLADRRNDLAHGEPLGAHPVGGLFELVRDLINYAYRDFIVGEENQSFM